MGQRVKMHMMIAWSFCLLAVQGSPIAQWEQALSPDKKTNIDDLNHQVLASYEKMLSSNAASAVGHFASMEAQGTTYPAPSEWGEMTRIGTEYGGYPIFLSRMKPDSASFSFGLGKDLSFDIALMKATKGTVHGFDNTPVHMEWWNQEGKESVKDLPFVHHELLLGVEDGSLKLQLPVGHGASYAPESSSSKGFQDNTAVELPAKMLKTIMAENNIQQLEVLKIDVEGAEWAILDSWLAEWGSEGLPACRFMIEFHQRLAEGDQAAQQAIRQKAVDQLSELGFQIAHHVDKEDGADDNLFINTKRCK